MSTIAVSLPMSLAALFSLRLRQACARGRRERLTASVAKKKVIIIVVIMIVVIVVKVIIIIVII